jgi:hypothetical protein
MGGLSRLLAGPASAAEIGCAARSARSQRRRSVPDDDGRSAFGSGTTSIAQAAALRDTASAIFPSARHTKHVGSLHGRLADRRQAALLSPVLRWRSEGEK